MGYVNVDPSRMGKDVTARSWIRRRFPPGDRSSRAVFLPQKGVEQVMATNT